MTKRVERTGPRAKTRLTIEPMIRDNAPDSRIIITLSRDATGATLGEPVLMTTNLPREAALIMWDRLGDAINECWPDEGLP